MQKLKDIKNLNQLSGMTLIAGTNPTVGYVQRRCCKCSVFVWVGVPNVTTVERLNGRCICFACFADVAFLEENEPAGFLADGELVSIDSPFYKKLCNARSTLLLLSRLLLKLGI